MRQFIVIAKKHYLKVGTASPQVGGGPKGRYINKAVFTIEKNCIWYSGALLQALEQRTTCKIYQDKNR